MKKIGFKKRLPLIIIAAALLFLIVCPLIMIFAEAAIRDGSLDFAAAWQTLAESENLQMILVTMLESILHIFQNITMHPYLPNR